MNNKFLENTLNKAIRFLKTDYGVILLYLVLILIFFNGIFVGKLPGPFEFLNIWKPWHNPEIKGQGNYILSDQVDGFFTTFKYLRDSILNGEIPFWDSTKSFGKPFLTIFFFMQFHPINLIGLILPTQYMWPCTTTLKVLLAGFYTFKILKQYNNSLSISIFGGIAYMFSLYLIVWIGSPIGLTAATIPFFVFGVIQFLEKGPNPRTKITLMISTISLILSGFPSIAFYAILIMGVYTLVNQKLQIFNKKSLSLLFGMILSFGTLIATLYYSQQFLTITGLDYRENKGLIFLPIKQFIQIAFPKIVGDYYEVAKNGFGNFNETTNYFSIFLLALTILNIVLLIWKSYRKRNSIVFWTGIQLWSVSMIYGFLNIQKVFSNLPIFSTNPSTRLQGIFVLSSIIIGCTSLDYIIKRAQDNSVFKKNISIVLTISITSAIVANRLHRYIDPIQTLKTTTHFFDQIIFLIICLSIFILIINSTQKQLQNILIFVLSVISFMNLYRLGHNYNSSYTIDSFYPETKIVTFLKENLTEGERIMPIGRNLLQNTNSYYGINSILSHAIKTQTQKDLLQKLNPDDTQMSNQATMSFLKPVSLININDVVDEYNIKYIIADESVREKLEIDNNEFKIVLKTQGLIVVENVNKNIISESCPLDCNDDTICNYYNHNNKIRFNTNLCNENTVRIPVWNYPGWDIEIKSSDSIIKPTTESEFIELTVPSGIQSIELRYVPDKLVSLLIVNFFFIIISIIYIFPKDIGSFIERQYLRKRLSVYIENKHPTT